MTGFVIHGTRGTLPACGPDFLRYGGDTTCFSLQTDEGILVIDVGTGLRYVTEVLAERDRLPPITVLLTHLHMDHLIGLPSFGPLYSADANIRFLADPRRDEDWRLALRAFMWQPYWPIGLTQADATVTYAPLPVDAGELDIYGIHVTWRPVPHPQQCLAYRLDTPDLSVVVATDAEFEEGKPDREFAQFCKGTDYLIFDAHFTPREYPKYRGWGHSTWKAGIETAELAEVERLVLTHHAPQRRDDELDLIVERASHVFPDVVAASSNLCLEPLPA